MNYEIGQLLSGFQICAMCAKKLELTCSCFNNSKVETKMIAAWLSRGFFALYNDCTFSRRNALGNGCSFSRPCHKLCVFAWSTDWFILSVPFVLIGWYVINKALVLQHSSKSHSIEGDFQPVLRSLGIPVLANISRYEPITLSEEFLLLFPTVSLTFTATRFF